MSSISSLTAVELRQLLDRREVSAVELTQACLSTIERHNPSINCFLSIEADRALEAAEAADVQLASRNDRHCLTGIPVAIKDIFERDGFDVTAGSKPWSFRSRTTSTVVEKLRQSGAIIMGTLNLDEFAAGGTGANVHFGRCVNPIDEAYMTGGSSSGSAAAVAAKMVPLTVGSDAGGSIRIPAAYCGVTGLKPTYGRVSRYGAVPRTWSMDCIGPIAGSSEDCALLLSAIAGSDPNDSTSWNGEERFNSRLDRDAFSGTIAVDQALLEQSHAHIAATTRMALTTVKEDGVKIVDTRFDNIDLLNNLQQIIVKAEGATYLGGRLQQSTESISTATRAVIQEGFLLPATSYIEALSLRAALLTDFLKEVMGTASALALPATPNPVPLYDADPERQSSDVDRQFTEAARFTRFANYLGLPAITLPVSKNKAGLPVSIQLIGRPWEEATLLSAASRIQKGLSYR